METLEFVCEKRGFCCRTLFENNDAYTIGLSLFPDETKLFDAKLVVQCLAFGLKKPSTIVSYQLTVAVCPHLTDNNECKIYDKRSLICKAFPLIPKFPINETAPKCPQICHHPNYRENGFSMIDAPASEDAAREINIKIITDMQKREKGAKLWVYDLLTKHWMLYK